MLENIDWTNTLLLISYIIGYFWCWRLLLRCFYNYGCDTITNIYLSSWCSFLNPIILPFYYLSRGILDNE